jgi:hypothetical protein
MRRRWATAAVATLGAALPASAGARERIVPRPVALPQGLRGPQFPAFTARGGRLLAVARSPRFAGTQVVLLSARGGRARCLTCGVWAGPPLQKPLPLPDGRRVLVRIGVQSAAEAADTGVLECAPSVLHCRTARVLPIRPPVASDPGVLEDQREYRIAPDGRHVALTQIRTTRSGRLDGVDVVGRLVRGRGAYRVAQPRVVATGAELKNFTPDGRGVLIARYTGGAEAANPDDFRVDLSSGRETRLTFNPDWEEDVDLSAQRFHGRRWMVVGSARQTGLLETVSGLRRPTAINPALSALPFQLFALRHSRIAEPWLVSLRGERRGRLGRRLGPGAIAHGWDSRANFSWKPDGTAVVFWQRRIRGPARTRIVVTRLPDRHPRPAPAPAPSGVGDWAPALAGYAPPDPRPARSRRGRVSGSMWVRLGRAPAGSGFLRTIRVRYAHFADRPEAGVLDGVERGLYDPAGLFGGPSRYSADLRLSGRHHGLLHARDVTIGAGRLGGVITSRLDGRRLRLGPLGP